MDERTEGLAGFGKAPSERTFHFNGSGPSPHRHQNPISLHEHFCWNYLPACTFSSLACIANEMASTVFTTLRSRRKDALSIGPEAVFRNHVFETMLKTITRPVSGSSQQRGSLFMFACAYNQRRLTGSKHTTERMQWIRLHLDQQ